MGQHLIPQAHLEGFAAKPGYIYVFDTRGARWNSDTPLPISKVAQSKNLWDEGTERDLGACATGRSGVFRSGPT